MERGERGKQVHPAQVRSPRFEAHPRHTLNVITVYQITQRPSPEDRNLNKWLRFLLHSAGL